LEYPQAAIVECEAVRYGYLTAAQRSRATQRAEAAQIRVLILGDVGQLSTIKLLRLLEAAVAHITARMTYTLKPHPYCMIEAQSHPSLSLTLLTSPLGEILHDFDVAYASNSTSAGLDAYLAGLPVVVMLDSAELNASPLRGQPDVRFVSTPEELAASLQAKYAASGAGRDRAGFFFLDPELPRWKRLLGL
jgi:surface carbohydrate biosynthesis protein (TIGR04326 family)